MYTVSKYSSVGNLLDLDKLTNLTSFPMGSKNKVFKINDSNVMSIEICNKKMAHPLVQKKVSSK